MKQKWSDVSDEPISEAGVRSLHVPQEIYKFGPATHAAGQAFTVKSANDFVLYLLNGSCKTTVDGSVVQLATGEFVFFAKGAYQFKANGPEDIQLICVSSRA